MQVNSGIALGVGECSDERGKRRLRRGAGQRRRGAIDDIGAGARRREVGSDLATGGIVRVDVDRQVEFLAQRGHQGVRGLWAQQAGHVLDSQDVRAGFYDLLGELQVVIQGVEVFLRRRKVTGIRHGHLCHGGIRLEYGVDGWAHLGDIVKRIENAEDIHAGLSRFLHEGAAHRIRVRGIAHGIAPAQEHLDVLVRHRLAQQIQAHPGILVEEAHGHVIGSTAPCLHGEEIWGQARHGLCRGNQGGAAHAGGKQGLVGIAERRIRDHQRVLGANLFRVLLRPELQEVIAGTARERLFRVELRQLIKRAQRGGPITIGLIHGDIRDVVQDTAGLIHRWWRLEQIWVLGNESGIDAGVDEVGFIEQCAQEADIGGHAGYVELV